MITFGFSYCPLICLICSKGENNEIKRTRKRALRTLYGDYESTFEELLNRDKSKTTYKKNLKMLMGEVSKKINHLYPQHMWKIFTRKNFPYNLSGNELCKIPTMISQCFGISTLSFRGSFYGIH